jgi:hypothetical protein
MGLFTKWSMFPSLFGKPDSFNVPGNTSNNGRKDVINLQDYISNHEVRDSWAQLYMKTVQSRKQFIREMDKVKSFYLVDALARGVADDALTPDTTTGEVIQLGSNDKAVQKELDVLQSRFDFDQLINDFIIDLLRQGEHVLSHTVRKGEGVVDIRDDVDQTNVIAFYKYGFPATYLTNTGKNMLLLPPYAYSHFAINRYKLRIQVQREFGDNWNMFDMDEQTRMLPSYVRAGRSIFYGVLSKIKELMLIELLIPTKKLNDIMKGNLVGLRMPQGTSAKDGFEATRTYEKYLNKKVGLDRGAEEFSAADIASIAGLLRVMPIFGEKGTLESLADIKEDRSLEALEDRIEDTRRVVCTSVGYPYELLFSSDGDRRGELLKRYGRYVRTLKSIQSSIAIGMKQICLAHVVNRGIQITPDDIIVDFRNKLIDTDELDKVELLDAVMGIIENVNGTVEGFLENEQLSDMIDVKKYASWLHQQVSIFGPEYNFIKPPGKFKIPKAVPDEEPPDDEPEPDEPDEKEPPDEEPEPKDEPEDNESMILS